MKRVPSGAVHTKLRFPIAIFCLLLTSALPGRAQQGGLDSSETLFAVLAAINVAGYDADAMSGANHPLRMAVRQAILAKNPPVLPRLKAFVEAHRQRDAAAELSQYISLAMTLTDPPAFSYRFNDNEMPLDALRLRGFEGLLAQFYQEAGIADLWRQAQPAIEALIERYHPPVVKAVNQVDGYLRHTGYLGRRFQVYLDIMGAPRQVHTRSYGKEFFLIVTHFPEPRPEYIRHAYLEYLLDPLMQQNTELLREKQPLEDFALGSGVLPEHYKEDFVLLAMRCLAKAIDIRFSPPPERAGMVAQALREGYILTAAFEEALAGYEAGEESMRFHLPAMIRGIDLAKETARLSPVDFLEAMPAAKPKVSESERARYEVARQLDEAEDLYARKEYEQARQTYRKVYEEAEESQLKARALYGLARLATLERDPDTAKQLFERALASAPDPGTASWAHLYLGRLADVRGDRDEALAHYQRALAVKDGSPKARQAAQQGLQQAFGSND